MRAAEVPRGAGVAQRLTARRADRRAEIHQRLIVFAWPLAAHRRGHPRAERAAVLRVQNVEPAPRDARGDAQDVAIDRGNGLPERDGENRPRRIVADARQGTESVVRLRKLPAVLLRDDFRRLLKIPRAAVVPSPSQSFISRSGSAAASAATSGNAAMNRSKYGSTAATRVCCSMISDTHVR